MSAVTYTSAPSGIAFTIDGAAYRTGSAGRRCFEDLRNQFGEEAARAVAADAARRMPEARQLWPASRRPNLRAGESEINVEGWLLALGFAPPDVERLAALYRSGPSATVDLLTAGARLPGTAARRAGSVFFDGSDEEVREHLRSIFGTPAFRLVGYALELELPHVGKDRRPRASGDTTIVSFTAPVGWTVKRAEGGTWSHAVPDGSGHTLCTISTSDWTTVVDEGSEAEASCPWCRARLIAIEVAAPPAVRVGIGWTTRCVYTMRHTRDLEETAASDGHATWQENRAWKTAKQLVHEAGPREAVPVIFSAADRDSGLIFFGHLEAVELNEDGTTRYSVSGLRPLPEPRALSDLRVVSSGEALPDTYIRPYAICYTPSFLPAPTARVVDAEGDDAHVTLHEEIAEILREAGNRWLTTTEIAERVNARGRYKKRDGTAVTAFQIHGRTKNYPALFERDGSRVRLREP